MFRLRLPLSANVTQRELEVADELACHIRALQQIHDKIARRIETKLKNGGTIEPGVLCWDQLKRQATGGKSQ